ncbi:hypothetical protein R50073_33900 [Maricurvus nonylphenolicus]
MGSDPQGQTPDRHHSTKGSDPTGRTPAIYKVPSTEGTNTKQRPNKNGAIGPVFICAEAKA